MPGDGEPVRRQHSYRIRLRLWLNKGQAVRWQAAWGPVGAARLEDDGATLMTEVRIDRRSLASGLFYGIEGMRVGGTRRLEIAPHLARTSSSIALVLVCLTGLDPASAAAAELQARSAEAYDGYLEQATRDFLDRVADDTAEPGSDDVVSAGPAREDAGVRGGGSRRGCSLERAASGHGPSAMAQALR